MKPVNLVLNPAEFEIGYFEFEGDWPSMTCYVVAEGTNAFEFFGGAIVEGIDIYGDLAKDFWVASKDCLFRDEAIEVLMSEWAKVHGPIAKFEVENILKLARPEKPKTYKTLRDEKRNET